LVTKSFSQSPCCPSVGRAGEKRKVHSLDPVLQDHAIA